NKKYDISRGRCSRDQACSKKAGKQDHYKNPINQKSCSQCALIHFLQIFQLLYTDIFKYAIHRFLVFPRLLSSAAIFVFLSASAWTWIDRKSTRLNSSHVSISYAVFCLKKKNTVNTHPLHALY